MKNRILILLVFSVIGLAASQSFAGFYWNAGNGKPPQDTVLTMAVEVYQMVDGGAGGVSPDSPGDEIKGIFRVTSIAAGGINYYVNQPGVIELTGAFWDFIVKEEFLTNEWHSEGGKFALYVDNSPNWDPDYSATPSAGDGAIGTAIGHGSGFADGDLLLDYDAVEGTDGSGVTMITNVISSMNTVISTTFLDIVPGSPWEGAWVADGMSLGGTPDQDFYVFGFAVSDQPYLDTQGWPSYGTNGSMMGVYVPEPSTLTGLLTLGMAAAAGLVWRRRKNA